MRHYGRDRIFLIIIFREKGMACACFGHLCPRTSTMTSVGYQKCLHCIHYSTSLSVFGSNWGIVVTLMPHFILPVATFIVLVDDHSPLQWMILWFSTLEIFRHTGEGTFCIPVILGTFCIHAIFVYFQARVFHAQHEFMSKLTFFSLIHKLIKLGPD
jgi:hypothetical protein